MAQYRKDIQQFMPDNKTIFEAVMLASASGELLSESNPIPTTNYGLQVARELVEGVIGISISGYNATISTNWVPIWEVNTDYTYFSSEQPLRIWSNNASDTNVSITIEGLNASYEQIDETVVLNNGITGVLTTKNFFRVNYMYTIGNVNALGQIRAGNSDKTITLAAISNGSGTSQKSVFTVPANHSFYLTQVSISSNQGNNQHLDYRVFSIDTNGITRKTLEIPFISNYNSNKIIPRKYPEKSDIQWQCKSTATSIVGIQIEGFLIADT